MSGHRPFRTLKTDATAEQRAQARHELDRTSGRPWWRLIRALDRAAPRTINLFVRAAAAGAVVVVALSILLLALGDVKAGAMGFLGAAAMGMGAVEGRRQAKRYVERS